MKKFDKEPIFSGLPGVPLVARGAQGWYGSGVWRRALPRSE